MILSQLSKKRSNHLRLESFNKLLINKLKLIKKKKYLFKNLIQFSKAITKNTNKFVIKNCTFINNILNNKNDNIYDNSSINYVFNIKVVKNNIFINITDIKGNTKFLYSAASAYRNRKIFTIRQKKQLNNLLIDLLKTLVNNTRFIHKNTAVLHFKNTNISQELLFINLIKNVFFIKSIKSFNSNPHNGCRPKKLKRIKSKKRLIL